MILLWTPPHKSDKIIGVTKTRLSLEKPMNREVIKAMFSTFQGLNLAFLREDLRRGLVAREAWIDRQTVRSGYIVCPVAHGWHNSHCWNSISRLDADFSTAESADGAGLDAGSVGRFVSWWDCDGAIRSGDEEQQIREERTKEFTEIIEEIWQERLTDADAVQGVIEEASETESVAQEVVACR